MKHTTERLMTLLALCAAVGAVVLLVAGETVIGAALLVAALALFAVATAPHGADGPSLH